MEAASGTSRPLEFVAFFATVEGGGGFVVADFDGRVVDSLRRCRGIGNY